MKGARSSPLSKAEQFEIASVLHALVLEELFRETDWLAPEAVFHGGTSLAIARESKRFSEDLDFMISSDAAAALEGAMTKVTARIDLTMATLYPGGRVTMKGPKGGEVRKWDIRWENPSRIGKVLVKAEFLVTRRELLAAYRTTHLVPTSRGAVSVSTPIPVPEFVSAWADKIKAIASRPEFKWRDAYDLAWIARCLRQEDAVRDGDRLEALAATASIYGKTLNDVAEGLDRVLATGIMDDEAAFEADMRRWFQDDEYPRMRTSGVLARTLADARREVARALNLIRSGGVDDGDA